ncbi:MAG: hypothetical protein K1X74_12070 [Pirellulales bacterium]|nr:hypothetical protein [Pirellulales bacterium]
MGRLVGSVLTLVLGVWFAAAAQADELDDAVAQIALVATEGQGNEAAGVAWATLAQTKSGELPRLLAALDRASPLAANWIRSAVDAVADKALDSGEKLPVQQLEEFVRNQRHSPRARRVAYECLCRVDDQAPDRLIPGMLEDPSVEFRRDAIDRLIPQAEAAIKADKKPNAVAIYRQAFMASRDLDQVQQLATELEKLGDKPDLITHLGFLINWQLAGPFDNTDGAGFDKVYPPEAKLDLNAEMPGKNGPVKWQAHSTGEALGKVDLNKVLGKESAVVAYALAEFNSERAMEVEIRYGTANATKLWVNGQLVAADQVYHAGNELDQYVARVALQTGRNLILFKLCQNAMKEDWAQTWDFSLRVCDVTGGGILSAKVVAANR